VFIVVHHQRRVVQTKTGFTSLYGPRAQIGRGVSPNRHLILMRHRFCLGFHHGIGKPVSKPSLGFFTICTTIRGPLARYIGNTLFQMRTAPNRIRLKALCEAGGQLDLACDTPEGLARGSGHKLYAPFVTCGILELFPTIYTTERFSCGSYSRDHSPSPAVHFLRWTIAIT